MWVMVPASGMNMQTVEAHQAGFEGLEGPAKRFILGFHPWLSQGPQALGQEQCKQYFD